MNWWIRLCDIKKDSKKTTEQISKETGIPKSTLDKLFAGRTKDPQLSTIRSVIHCLGYTLDDLDDMNWAKKGESSTNQISEEAIEVAEAYDNAPFKDKNMARMALNLPLLETDVKEIKNSGNKGEQVG